MCGLRSNVSSSHVIKYLMASKLVVMRASQSCDRERKNRTKWKWILTQIYCIEIVTKTFKDILASPASFQLLSTLFFAKGKQKEL